MISSIESHKNFFDRNTLRLGKGNVDFRRIQQFAVAAYTQSKPMSVQSPGGSLPGCIPKRIFSPKDLIFFFIKAASVHAKKHPQTREFMNIMLTVHMFEHGNIAIKNENRDKNELLMYRITHIDITNIKGIR